MKQSVSVAPGVSTKKQSCAAVPNQPQLLTKTPNRFFDAAFTTPRILQNLCKLGGTPVERVNPAAFRGLELTLNEQRALHAVFDLLSRKDSWGPIEMKLVEYLRAYGVGESVNKVGKRKFSGREGHKALQALQSLASRRRDIFYRRCTGVDRSGNKLYDIMVRTEPLILIERLYRGISESETWTLVANPSTFRSRLAALHITVNPLLVANIQNRYRLMPPIAELYGNLKDMNRKRHKRTTATDLRLVTWLFRQGAGGSNHVIEFGNKLSLRVRITMSKLADQLGLTRYWHEHRRGYVTKTIIQSCQLAVDLHYLLHFETATHETGEIMMTLWLDVARFFHLASQMDPTNLQQVPH